MAKKRVGSSQSFLLTDTTEKVVRRDFEGVCQTAEIVERRLAGSGFEMGDGGRLQTRSFCQLTKGARDTLESRVSALTCSVSPRSRQTPPLSPASFPFSLILWYPVHPGRLDRRGGERGTIRSFSTIIGPKLQKRGNHEF